MEKKTSLITNNTHKSENKENKILKNKTQDLSQYKSTSKQNQKVEENKQEKQKTGLFTNKPSDKFKKQKTADPFTSTKKHKTNFGYVYSSGGIPCRINHGSVNHKIQWDIPIQDLDYDPLLINCFEGLLETDHPYNLVANRALRELLEAEGASEKTIPLISKLIMPLRNSFLSPDKTIWLNGLEALKLLSQTVGCHLTPHIHILLAQLGKKMTTNKQLREKIFVVLNTIEEQGGKEALDVLKSKIPTYNSVYS